MPVNDAHCHFFSPRFFETLAGDAGGRFDNDPAVTVPAALGWDAPGTPQRLANRWMAEIDRHQVQRAVLIASVPGDEHSVLEALATQPAAFVGFFMVNPLADGAVDRTRQALADGLRGVCLFPAMQRYSLLDARVAAIVDVAAETRSAAVFVHCGVLSVGARKKLGLPSRFEARFGGPLDVQALATAWPHVPFIIPHFGAGFFREALMAADMCPNIHLDTSSSNGWMKYIPGLTLETVFRHAIQVVGPERLLFGTDSSFFPRGWQRPVFETQVEALNRLNLNARDVDLILGGNFDRLFPLSTRQT
jgi:predicted TIM-barrel fold metal-dependent hydrolase